MAVCLHKTQKARRSGRACIYYLDETWVNHSVGLRVPVSKSGQLPVCHAGSAATGFIPERKLIFHSKSKALTYYHNETTYETFKKWSEEQFLLYISP
jgi:hypothetical protein